MKKVFLFGNLLMSMFTVCAQCPFPVSLNGSSATCVGSVLNVITPNSGLLSRIVWLNENTPVQTSNANTTSGTGITVAGLNGRGSAQNQLNNPIAVFVDDNGNVYIVDRLNYRVQKWGPGALSGTTVAGGNGQGPAANQFTDPIGLFVDAAANIYVADYGNNRIQKWAAGASTGITVAGGNGAGTAANQLTTPTGVFVDVSGNIFIADAGNDRIQEWAPNASSGVTVAGANGGGSAANQLRYPTSVVADAAGNLYIADELNDRIQKWAPGASSGITVAGGNGAGSAANQFTLPYSVFVDQMGNIYAADLVNDRVEEWPPGASQGINVAGKTAGGPGPDQLLAPQCVYVDSHGAIYIADYGNNRVQKWAAQSFINTSYKPVAAGNYKAVITGTDGCTVTTEQATISAQVTPAIAITSPDTTVCEGVPVTFNAVDTNGGTAPSWQWLVNGVNTGAGGPVFTRSDLFDGDIVHCVFTSSSACASPVQIVSNNIVLSIKPAIANSVSITASSPAVCAGVAAVFTAVPGIDVASQAYHWQVDGISEGVNSNTFSSLLANGDVVTCMLTNPASCLTASSDPISIIVNDTPHIDRIPDISITPGQQFTISPIISGAVDSYSWQPAEGLSNALIQDPVASPVHSTIYTLAVVGEGGCRATATATVKVIRPLRIPGAFTPNGDGKNDVFYILGAPDDSRIKEFSVYNRWGQPVFAAHDILADDPNSGWNGKIKGVPAPAGTYVYQLTIISPAGKQTVYSGSVVLVR